ncbi:MAG: glycogen synthase, partial [Verrucomicrobiae bacterium]|nr:glycogen synthase [Verrucomicrobiae bacterium]
MKIVHVSSEQVPFIKTGGLADVVGALAHHTAKMGHDVVCCLPLYRGIQESEAFKNARKQHSLAIKLGDEILVGEVYKLKLDKHLDLLLIGRDEFFDRSFPYGPKGRDYSDNDARFIFYCKAVVETLVKENIHADILHCHDWQTALVPIFSRVSEAQQGIQVGARSILTIHNLAFQGVFPEKAFYYTNLPAPFYSIDGLEFYGQVNFLKGGLCFADAITTVSPNYAKEILKPEFGCGLEGVLNRRKDELFAILNGIDTTIWDPARDSHLPRKYSVKKMAGKAKNKAALMERAGLQASAEVPVYGVVSRLTDQKGTDFILKQKAFFADNDVRLVILGRGDPKLELGLQKLQHQLPDKVYVSLEYDEQLGHLIEAGSDFFLMPSRFEPCGLNQMYSQRYGTIPLVS